MTAVSAARARRPRRPTPARSAPAPPSGLALGFPLGLGGEFFLFPTLREGFVGEGGKARGVWRRVPLVPGREGRCGRCPLIPRVGTTRGGGASPLQPLPVPVRGNGGVLMHPQLLLLPARPRGASARPPAGCTRVTPPAPSPLPGGASPRSLRASSCGDGKRGRHLGARPRRAPRRQVTPVRPRRFLR